MRQKAFRSFPNRYPFSLYYEVISSFSIRYNLEIILAGNCMAFGWQPISPLFLYHTQGEYTDDDTFGFGQCLGAGKCGGSRGHYVVNEQHMAPFDGLWSG